MFELSVRRKVVLVVVALSLVILAFGAGISFYTLKSTSGREGRYLKPHLERFRSALAWTGANDYAIAGVIASNPDLAAALAAEPPRSEEPKAEPKKEGGKKDDATKNEPAAEPAPSRPAAGDATTDAMRRIVEAILASVDPELLCVLDMRDTPVGDLRNCKLPRSAFRETRLLQDVRAGTSVRAEVAMLGGTAYLVGGVAVRHEGRKSAVGTVLVGRKLQTYLEQYALGSGAKDPEKQHRVTLLKQDATVLASPLPKEEWGPFAAEARKGQGNYQVAMEGDEAVPILEYADKVYDFYDSPATGYDGLKGPEPGHELGRFFLVRTREHKEREIRTRTIELAAFFAGAAVASIVVGWLLARHITRPIERYIAATEGLAAGQGDLTQRLEVHANDELGRLAKNLNRVFEQIHALAGRVQRTAFRVGDSSTQLSASSRAMLDGAKTQAVKIENSTAAVTELSASIQQVAENAGEATKVAQKSGEAAGHAIQRLGLIRSTVEEAGARIEALGESGKRIGTIVEVIRHISEQTTLLALNAAIEAAHAGEQGRGFAVVADEVSNLAKRVGRSAKDIEDLIATIRDQTSEAVRAMQAGTREVEEGTQLVTNTLAELKKLIGVVEDTANAVNEQAIASDEIARNMDAVRTIAREVLSSSEQAVKGGDELTRLAHLLEESVKGFKIDASRIDDVESLRQLPPAGPVSPRLG